MKRTRYPAKIDWGISVLLAGLAILCIGLGIVSLFFPTPAYIGGMLLLLTGALLQSIWMRTVYKIDQRYIRVECGPLWWSVPLEQIYLVEKTSSTWLMMGGPHLRFSLSRHGLMIHYRRHPQHKWFGLFDPAILISPAERDQFLAAIQSARPDLISTSSGHLGTKE